MAFKLRAQGVLDYVNYLDQQEALKEARMDKKEALALNLMSKYGAGTFAGMGTKSGKASAAAVSSNAATQMLRKNYGLDDDVLAPILATGDPKGSQKILDILNEQRKLYKKNNMELPDSVIQEVVGNAVLTQPTNKPIDFTEVENYIGREMDSLYKEILQQGTTTAGEVLPFDPGFAEIPSLSDIPTVMQAAVQDVSGTAKREQSIIKRRQAELLKLRETDSSGIYQNEFNILTDRLDEITSAVDNIKDDPSQIISLYGNSYAKKLFSSDAGQSVKNLPLPSILTDAMSSYPMVSSIEMGVALLNAGVFEPNTIVRLPTGQTVELVPGSSPTQ
ncbi:hypothetical protein N9924_00415 [bacterium]|nr:hypothetical protein [bacterium]